MSWLVNSLANSLKLDDDHTPLNTNDRQPHTSHMDQSSSPPPPPDQASTPRGVKDDLSELSKTLTRQLWGVASFLAPPPQSSSSSPADPPPQKNPNDVARIAGIKHDLSEIGGKFRTEISKLSSNKAVSEFTKIASNLLQFGADEDLSPEDYARRGVVGVTDEVVAFARDVAMHPETWLDFPLPHDDDEDDDDFDLSDAQQEHALAVECLAPELAALRAELCLGYMTEGSFWKIYFVLVHPRLSKHDAVILSTPPVVKARAMLTLDLHNRGKSRQHDSSGSNVSVDESEQSHEAQLSVPVVDQTESVPVEILPVEPASSVMHEIETDKHLIARTEEPVIDKEVIEEVSVKQTLTEKSTATTNIVDTADDEDDEWLKEDSGETELRGTSYPLGNDDEDVSFSDLEEDDDVRPSNKKAGQSGVNSSGSNKVSINTSKNKESNDWLDVEDIADA